MILTDSSLTNGEPGSRLQVLLPRWSKYFAVTIFVIVILVLIGWQWDILFFKQPIPRTTPMAPLTALAFLVAAASLLAFSKTRRPGKTGSLLIARMLAVLV